MLFCSPFLAVKHEDLAQIHEDFMDLIWISYGFDEKTCEFDMETSGFHLQFEVDKTSVREK